MTDEVLAELIAIGHEARAVEFKGPGRRDDAHTLAVVIRAMLAMANLPRGGVVIIGVSERADKTLDPVGLSAEFAGTWLAFDLLSDQVARYAEPSMTFEVESRSFDGKQFVVISVQEFVDSPIICRQAFISQADPTRNRPASVEVLRAGAIYVRAKGRPASIAVPDSDHMRELITLAVRKAVGAHRELSKLERNAGEDAALARLYDDELGGLG